MKRLSVFLIAPFLLAAEPPAAAVAAFNAYSDAVDSRLAQQHRSPKNFLTPAASIERLTPPATPEFQGALLHHWRGTTFAAGAEAADFERLLRDFDAYPKHFSPQVLQSRVLSQDEDRLEVKMRVRQHHVITVVMDTTYDVTFGELDAQHRYSRSKSTRIEEINSTNEDHGFLWRLNTWWSYEQRDGGLYLQIESVSLTRSIPRGLGWVIRPYIESIPRESLEFTLNAARNALSNEPKK